MIVLREKIFLKAHVFDVVSAQPKIFFETCILLIFQKMSEEVYNDMVLY